MCILHRAKLGDDGFYHLGRGYSDEYGYAEDPNLDLQMLRWGLETLVASAERLKIEDPLLPKWKEILKKLVPYPVDEHGLMIGSDVPFAKPHRHYSHLLGIFPLYVINIDDQPDMLEILKKSINRHTDIDGDNCMYKFTGSSSLSAALGDGDRALQMLERSLQLLPPQQAPTVMPNTLYSEGQHPTFESPISAARNVLDMVFAELGPLYPCVPRLPIGLEGRCVSRSARGRRISGQCGAEGRSHGVCAGEEPGRRALPDPMRPARACPLYWARHREPAPQRWCHRT